MSIFHDHCVARINVIEADMKEAKDEIKQVKDKIKAVEQTINSIKQLLSNPETPQTAKLQEFYDDEVKRLVENKAKLEADEKFFREKKNFLLENEMCLRKRLALKDEGKRGLQERLYQNEEELRSRAMQSATLNPTETVAIQTQTKRRTSVDDKPGRRINETRPGRDDDNHAVCNASQLGTDKSTKGKSQQAQGKIKQRDSDNWAARMKVLDTGADVANELDLLDMLDDEQDRKDIVESVMFRSLVMHLCPGIYKIRDDEPNDDGSLVLTAANLERHLKSLGQESNHTQSNKIECSIST